MRYVSCDTLVELQEDMEYWNFKLSCESVCTKDREVGNFLNFRRNTYFISITLIVLDLTGVKKLVFIQSNCFFSRLFHSFSFSFCSV